MHIYRHYWLILNTESQIFKYSGYLMDKWNSTELKTIFFIPHYHNEHTITIAYYVIMYQ